jgi:hypothetical protein
VLPGSTAIQAPPDVNALVHCQRTQREARPATDDLAQMLAAHVTFRPNQQRARLQQTGSEPSEADAFHTEEIEHQSFGDTWYLEACIDNG